MLPIANFRDALPLFPGAVYRSASLDIPILHNQDTLKVEPLLQALNIQTIIDLRGEGEKKWKKFVPSFYNRVANWMIGSNHNVNQLVDSSLGGDTNGNMQVLANYVKNNLVKSLPVRVILMFVFMSIIGLHSTAKRYVVRSYPMIANKEGLAGLNRR